MKVKVLTDICTLGDKGEQIDVDDTPATAALIAAGHVKPVRSPKTANDEG